MQLLLVAILAVTDNTAIVQYEMMLQHSNISVEFKHKTELWPKVQRNWKDTDNPPDVNGASQAIRVLRKLVNVFANHHSQLANSRYSQRVCQNASQPDKNATEYQLLSISNNN